MTTLNPGLKLEQQFIAYFNNKRFADLSPKWQKHFLRMFPDIRKRDIIYSYKYKDDYAKPDIVIEVGSQRILLSIKTGHNPTMHTEKWTSFYAFLKDLGVPYDVLAVLVLYHFGESKRYGHKEKPLSKQEIVERYGALIRKANKCFNSGEELIKKVARRAITRGAISTRERIDFFYYGVIEKGFLCSRKQIMESVVSRREPSDQFLHFGELVYQPNARTRKTNDFLYSSIHWPILSPLFYEIPDEDNFLKGRKTGVKKL